MRDALPVTGLLTKPPPVTVIEADFPFLIRAHERSRFPKGVDRGHKIGLRKMNTRILAALSLATSAVAQAQTPTSPSALVTIDNYSRAQSDVYFAGAAKGGGFGRFQHSRELTPPQQRGIIRPNRDTLYSFGVFDLDAGPVTITVPKGAPRLMGMQVVNEDQFTPAAYYGAGAYTLTKEKIGTRYAMAVVRFLVDFSDKHEVQRIYALQDAIKVEQASPGRFEIPNWDEASLNNIRTALLQLGTTISDTRRMYGANKNEVDPVSHLIGSAMLWGGNREKDALYLPTTPARNDGKTVYRLTVKDVPVDGFWSVTVYNSEGYFDPNSQNAYSVNSITVKTGSDGSVTIQFGGCDGKIQNCLPIAKAWNYTVRLFRPRAEILKGLWRFPLAQPVP
jgi:hypothetical protein